MSAGGRTLKCLVNFFSLAARLKLPPAFPWNSLYSHPLCCCTAFFPKYFSPLPGLLPCEGHVSILQEAECLYGFFLNWSTALYVTAINSKYLYKCCTCAWLNKVTELFFLPGSWYESKGCSLTKQSADQQHVPPADSHSSCSLLGCSLSQSHCLSVFAALGPHPWPCWYPRWHFCSVLDADQT